MYQKTTAAVLTIATLTLGVAGCRSDNIDYRKPPYYRINYLLKNESAMENLLKAAVYHKCLPQVVNDSNVTCTSVDGNISVMVRLDSPTLTVQPSKIARTIDKDEYNEWVESFGQKIRGQFGR